MAFDVVVVCATDTEMKAVDAILKDKYPSSDNPHGSYVQFRKWQTSKGLNVAAVKSDYMGQVNAAITACKLIYEFQPSLILSVGVAAGIRQKTSILDVLIADQVIDISLGKVSIDPKTGNQSFRWDYRSGTCDQQMATRLKSHFEKKLVDYYSEELLKNDKLKDLNAQHGRKIEKEEDRTPAVLHDGIFSGNLVRNDGDKLLEEHANGPRKAIGCEMESFGFTEAIKSCSGFTPVRFSMVKGVVDFAFNKESDWQKYVSEAVVQGIVDFIEDMPLDDEIKKSRSGREEQISNRVASTLVNLQTPSTPVQAEISQALVNSATREAQEVNQGKCTFRIDPSSQYLMRSKHLFKDASEVISTSIDTVSRFWTGGGKSSTLAKEYFDAQRPSSPKQHRKISRLFVFHSVADAHDHAEVLDAHTQAYRHVFVCSASDYVRLMKGAIVFDHETDYLETDFAVFKYGKKNKKNPERFFGLLKKHNFSIERIGSEDSLSVQSGQFNIRKLQEIFDKMLNTSDPGHISKINGAQILTWRHKFWDENQRKPWEGILTQLFPPNDSKNTIHMLFLRSPKTSSNHEQTEAVEKVFGQLKTKVFNRQTNEHKSIAERYNIEDIWFGKRKLDNFIDTLTNARLDLGENDPTTYAIMMKFKSGKDLERFYQEQQPSELRHDVYKQLSSNLKVVITNCKDIHDKEIRTPIFQLVEAEASRYMIRRDFVESDEIHDIVARQPYKCCD